MYIYICVCDFPIKTPFIYSRFEQLSPLMTGGYGIFFHGPAEKPIESRPEAWKAGGKAIPRTGLKERASMWRRGSAGMTHDAW